MSYILEKLNILMVINITSITKFLKLSNVYFIHSHSRSDSAYYVTSVLWKQIKVYSFSVFYIMEKKGSIVTWFIM